MNNLADPFNKIDTIDLISKIERWKEVDLRVISDKDLTLKLLETIPALFSSTVDLRKEYLYRVRPISEGEKFHSKSDVWYPPQESVKKRGRINKVGESILYCSLDQITPLLECSIKPGDWYALMQYKIKDGSKVQVTNVIYDESPPKTTPTGLINHKIINQFIYNEFTKPVGIGTEYLYRASHMICYNFMDVANCDGYLYPSIASYNKGKNIALKAITVDNHIEFDCLLICKLIEYNFETASCRFYVKHKAKLSLQGELKYIF